MTVGALIVARLSSTRLPAKCMADLAGRPMIARLVERVAAARHIDRVVIATSDEPSDDPLARFAADEGIAVHRGPLNSVMERICGAARAFDCDTVVEILGDNPLVHSALIDDVIDLYHDGGFDYAANVSGDYRVRPENARLFAIGIRVQVYPLTLAERHSEFPTVAADPSRHPSSYLFDNPDRFRIGYLRAEDRWAALHRPRLNLAVNYPQNLTAVRAIFEAQLPADADFGLDRVMAQLDADPDLAALFGAPAAQDRKAG